MFKNREVRIALAKKPKDEDTTPTVEQVLNPDSVKLIEETGRRFVKHVAITVAAVVIAIKVIDTAGDIVVNNTTPREED